MYTWLFTQMTDNVLDIQDLNHFSRIMCINIIHVDVIDYISTEPNAKV